MRTIVWITSLVLLCLCCACGDNSPAKTQATDIAYFDLQQYFKAEISRLNASKPLAIKKVTIEGKTEEMETDSLDFASELQVFIDADINRPAWKGRYFADMSEAGPPTFTVKYVAVDKGLPVKSVTVAYKYGEVAAIEVERSTKTLLAGSRQKLNYRPVQGYSVQTVQEALFRADQQIEIEVSFLVR